MRTPDKWIRKYFSQTLAGLTVSGKLIPISDFRLPANSDAYILMTTIDKSNPQEVKCHKTWNVAINLDVNTVYPGNTGSRVLADDIHEAVLNACNNIQVENFTVQHSWFDFAPDLSSITSTQSHFRKIIIFNLKLTENG